MAIRPADIPEAFARPSAGMTALCQTHCMQDRAALFRWRWFTVERCHVDHEPIANVSTLHPVERLVDILDRDDFTVRQDVLLGAEIEHLLCLRNAAGRW